MVVTRWGGRFMGRRFPVSIGRGGMTDDKCEGDGATPRGVWRMMEGRYRADRCARPHTALAMRPIGPRDLWSDDPDDHKYNQAITAPYPHSCEHLRRSDRLYDVLFVTDWNWPLATPEKGSAIFVHQWRKPRHPTAGCLAFRPDHLRWIAARITPQTRLFIR